jgi:hypothetical protein
MTGSSALAANHRPGEKTKVTLMRICLKKRLRAQFTCCTLFNIFHTVNENCLCSGKVPTLLHLRATVLSRSAWELL